MRNSIQQFTLGACAKCTRTLFQEADLPEEDAIRQAIRKRFVLLRRRPQAAFATQAQLAEHRRLLLLHLLEAERPRLVKRGL